MVNADYDSIKQVYSIWICMDEKKNSLSHIHLVKDDLVGDREWKGNIDILNIVMVGVTDDIPEKDEKYELHRLIAALLSDKMGASEKFDLIEREYGMEADDDLRKEVNIMCNLSDGLEERITKRVTDRVTEEVTASVTASVTEDVTKRVTKDVTKQLSEKFILSMYKKGYTTDQIADVAETSVNYVKAIVENAGAVLA